MEEYMSHTHQELADIFPEYKDKIHTLKTSDKHFARLAKKHHKTNRKIHRYETGVKATSDFHLEDLKKKRLYLLDIIQHILTQSP
jgi:uncharacterized protein YdcH (DUF465 family)